MSYLIQAACISHPGKIRSGNEDNFCFNNIFLAPNQRGTDTILTCLANAVEGSFFAVFDGMGGEKYGEVASFLAAEKSSHWVCDPDDPEGSLGSLALKLNKSVLNGAAERLTRHMGTTMVSFYFLDDTVFTCNVGDSRAFLIRGGKLAQLSQDHVEDFSAMGIETKRKPPLSQYLGVDPEDFVIEPYIVHNVIQEGDRFLLCSDGLTDMVSAEKITEIMLRSETTEACVSALLSAALEGGGEDNTTVIVCTITTAPEKGRKWFFWQ